VVMTYGIAIVTILVNAAFTFVYVFDLLYAQYFQYSNIVPHRGSVSIFASKGWFLNSAYFISSIISFVTTWVATILLLNHYSNKIGKVKYWVIVSIPLIYFLGQFQPLFLDIFSSYRQANPTTFGIIYTLIFVISKPVGGILFGIAFWVLAKTVSPNKAIRDFLLISGCGLVLLFTSNQGIVIVNYPYPPFGLAAISYIGISSYLLFIGIYASAISIAHDVNLRKALRSFLTTDLKLLDSIGTAHMQEEIQKKVIDFASRNQEIFKQETGVESLLDEQDVKQYLQEAIQEIKRKPMK
jgi:hypothetical protein